MPLVEHRLAPAVAEQCCGHAKRHQQAIFKIGERGAGTDIAETGDVHVMLERQRGQHFDAEIVADEVFAMQDIMALTQHKTARAYGRLHVLDVSDIFNPKPVAFYEPEYGGVHNIWVAGDTLYMGAYNAGFPAFDISGELRGDLRAQQREIAQVNPSDPNGWIPNATMTWGVVVKDGIAYVNDFNSGLFLVKIAPKPTVVP